MKKILVLIVLVLAAVLLWTGLTKKTARPQTGAATATTEEDLNKELDSTVDDRGAADFGELQNSAEGL